MTSGDPNAPSLDELRRNLTGASENAPVRHLLRDAYLVGPDEAVTKAFASLSKQEQHKLTDECTFLALSRIDWNTPWLASWMLANEGSGTDLRDLAADWQDFNIDANGWKMNWPQYFDAIKEKQGITLNIGDETFTNWRTRLSYNEMLRRDNPNVPEHDFCVDVVKLLRVAYECAKEVSEEEATERVTAFSQDRERMEVIAWLDVQNLLTGYPHCSLPETPKLPAPTEASETPHYSLSESTR
jgi:hypothetical protein